MENKKKEIDIIIEQWLKKIVEDKINDRLQTMDFERLAKDIITNKYKEQFESLDVKKIIQKIPFKEVLSRLDREESYRWWNQLNYLIWEWFKKWLDNFLSKELSIYWNESNFFENKNLDVKEMILKDEKINKKFIDVIKWFFK